MPQTPLSRAYRAAHYRVELPAGPVTLRVEQHSAALAAWLASLGTDCAALLTAHNPASRPQGETRNSDAQRQLVAVLRTRGHGLAFGHNLDPAGHWPPEDSVLAAGLTCADARALAAQFGQLAFLWCDAAATPRLVWTDAG